MADYTELVKELRYCVDGDEECAGCKRYGQMSCEVDLMEEAAYAIEHLNNLCMDLRGELERTLDNYKLEKVLREELNTGLIESVKRIPQWIPVTKQLPEDFKSVLVYTPKFLNQFMAYRKDDGWRVWSPQDNHGVPFINGQGEITHWMPLPKAPKEET